jgi:hypothetical protein
MAWQENGKGATLERHVICELVFIGLLASLSQFRYLLLTVYPLKALYTKSLLLITYLLQAGIPL